MVRLLRVNEIECRVATINEKGLSLLLYKDARVDQKILDETFGPFGWKRSHQCIDGNLYCTVEIYDKTLGEWVSKQDVGTTGFTEKEKSQASDSFKRACFNWGIGRELYTAPFIWIPAGKTFIQSRGDRYYCNDHFSVKSIEYNEEREIVSIIIMNGRGQVVFESKDKISADNAPKNISEKRDVLSPEQMVILKSELERTGVEMDTVKSRYKIEKPEDMSVELYQKVMSALAKTKSAKVA